MNFAFFHSHKFRFDGTNYYSAGGLDEQVLLRYIGSEDTITVYARVVTMEKGTQLKPIKNPRIHIVNYKTVQLADAILNADFSIMRIPCGIALRACGVANRLKRPYMVEVVASAWDSYWNHSFLGKFCAGPMELWTKICAKKAPYASYVTQHFLQKHYPCLGKCVGVSDTEMPVLEEKILANRLDMIQERRNRNAIIQIGTVGGIDVAAKSQRTVISALGILKKQGKTNYQYMLIGSGNPESLRKVAVDNDVEEQVVFLGAISHDQIFDVLDDLDLYIQPSRQEGLSRALLEAISRACPAIASDVGGNGELIPQRWLFRHGLREEQKVAKMIEAFTWDKMKEEARINFHKATEYQPEALRKKREDFFNYVVNNSKKVNS